MYDNTSRIIFHNLTTGYGKGRSRSEVSRSISGELRAGTLVALIGRNGMGKSTLLRTLAGFIPPIAGKVCIDNVAAEELSQKGMSQKVAVVLTGISDTGFLTAEEIVFMGRQPHTGFFGRLSNADKAVCAKSLKSVNAEPLAQKMFRRLSDGERQRVMIAKALAQETPFILLDEPTAYLDFPSKLETMQLLRSLAHESGKGILFTTHDVDMALNHADILWIMGKDHIRIMQPKDFDFKILYE